MLDRASRWYAKASYDRMRLEGAIAPTFVADRSRGGCSGRTRGRCSRSSVGLPRAACRSTARADLRRPGPEEPVVRAGQRTPQRRRGRWGRDHAEHAVAPQRDRRPRVRARARHAPANVQACRRGAHVCRHGNHGRRPSTAMVRHHGHGSEWFGAYNWRRRAGTDRQRAAGTGGERIRPQGSGEPTLLRLRAADRDWYIESHTAGWTTSRAGATGSRAAWSSRTRRRGS